MTKLRQLWLLTALAAVAVLAGGYFLMVSPKSNQASTLRGEAQAQQQANQGLQSQIAALNKQKKDLPKKQAALAEFAGKIPNNPALPALVRTLSDAADRAGVDLVSITPAAPQLSKGVDAKGNPVAGNIPAPGGTVLATIPVGINVVGEYSNITQFFAELESLNRALLVSGFNLIPGVGPAAGAVTSGTGLGTLSATISANVMMTTKAPVVAPVPVASAVADSTK